MITQAEITRNILAYLNGELSEADFIQWAEDAFVAVTEADEDIPNETAVLDILGYLGAGDTSHFPLTWSVLVEFLEQLGTKVRVVAQAS